MPKCIDRYGTALSPHVRADQSATAWEFCTAGATAVTWDWDAGVPVPQDLGPVRAPKSTAKSRHAPVLTFSHTTGTTLRLESGLEMDLEHALDREDEIVWIVPQPVRLRFDYKVGKTNLSHVPDLLTVDADGNVTLWDVRAPERRSADFMMKASLTADACGRVGWGYRLFGELPGLMRINLMWLNNYRRPQPWYASAAIELNGLLADGTCTVGTVIDADSGSGHLISTMWHLIWSGDLICDLTVRLGSTLSLRVA